MLERIKKIKFEHIRISVYIISIILFVLVSIGKIQMSCFWKENYGILCPSCGLTRATISIAHFKFKEAYKFNAFYTCVLMPLILILVTNDVYIILKRKTSKTHDISLVEILLGAKN